MEVTLTVVFEVNARRKRHRNRERIVVMEEAEFHLAEAHADDVPVAARSLGIVEDRVRWDGEAFWAPEIMPYSSHGTDPVSWSERSWNPKGMAPAIAMFRSGRTFRYGQVYLAGEVYDEDEIRDAVDSTFEAERLAQAAWLRDNVLVVDGSVYRRSPEPVFALRPGKDCAVTLGTSEPRDYVSWFSLTRREDAAEAVAASGGDPESLPGPEILLPQAFTVRDEELSLRSACLSLLADCHSLEDLPDEAGAAWFHLRSAFRRFDRELGEETGEEACRRIEEFLSALAPAAHTWFAERHMPRLEQAVGRWKARPVELALGFAGP